MTKQVIQNTQIADVNNSGEETGSYVDSNGIEHGFLERKGSDITLDFPGSVTTLADLLNDRGAVVGDYFANGSGHGFLFDHGQYTTIANPPNSHELPSFRDINNSDQILGDIFDGAHQFSFIYDNGTYTDLHVPGEIVGGTQRGLLQNVAFDINNKGEAVGFYQTPSLGVQAFAYKDGTYTTLLPNSAASQAYGVNDKGEVVGWYNDGTTGVHDFLFDPHHGGSVTNIDPPGGATTSQMSINDKGQVIEGGFLYDHGVFTNLNPGGLDISDFRNLTNSGLFLESAPDAQHTLVASIHDLR